jgi:hypothetical protein
MTLDPKVRELLDLAADAPPIGTVPVEVMREDAASHLARGEGRPSPGRCGLGPCCPFLPHATRLPP